MYIYFTFGGETNVKRKKKKTLTGPYFSKSCLDSIGIIPLSIRIRLSLSIFILVSFDASIGLSRMVNLSWNALFHSLIFSSRQKTHRNFQISEISSAFFFSFVLFFCFFFFTWFLNFYGDWSRRRVLWRELCIRRVSISRVCIYWTSTRLSSRSKGTGNDAPVRKSSANAWSLLSSGWNDIRSWGIRTFYARSGDIYTCPSSFSPTYNRHNPCCSTSRCNAPLGNYLKTSIRMMVNRG